MISLKTQRGSGPSLTLRTKRTALLALSAVLAGFCFPIATAKPVAPSGAAIDAEVSKIMTRNRSNGMAVAVIDHGRIDYVRAYGSRNTQRDPLTTDTVMYGASLTKTVFAFTVMQLVDQGKLKLDEPLKDDLDKPLPSYGPDPVFPDKYGPYKDLAGDPRWEEITPRTMPENREFPGLAYPRQLADVIAKDDLPSRDSTLGFWRVDWS